MEAEPLTMSVDRTLEAVAVVPSSNYGHPSCPPSLTSL